MQCVQYCSPICIVVNVHVSVDMNYAPLFVIYVYCSNVFVLYKIFSTGLALALMHVTITRMLSSVLQTVYDKIYYEKTNFWYLRTE